MNYNYETVICIDNTSILGDTESKLIIGKKYLGKTSVYGDLYYIYNNGKEMGLFETYRFKSLKYVRNERLNDLI